MEGHEIRRTVIRARNRLTATQLKKKSSAVISNLERVDEFHSCRTVMFYAHFRSEVQTMKAVEKCLALGKRVALPLTVSAENRLYPYLVEDPARDLKSGYCSIPEPDPAIARLLAPEDIGVVVVPGSVFDASGGRFGYGGGFYDRFLANDAPQAFRIGLAFELQVVTEALPLAGHDQRMDCLVTEKNIFRIDRRR